MRKSILRLVLLWALLACSTKAWANEKIQGWCEQGGYAVTIPGTQGSGTQRFQQTYRSCTVTIYIAGSLTLATLYSDNLATPTPQANPFTASATGYWSAYAAQGRYDVKFSGAGIATPFTLGDFILFDPDAVTVINNREYCITGANFGAKFTAAVALLPSTGGIVDCSNLQGAQSIASDVFTANTKPIRLLWPSGTASAAVSITVPTSIEIDFGSAGVLSQAAATTATINGSVSGAMTTHFSGSGNVVIGGRTPIVYPQWWGALADDSNNDATAIQSAINAVGVSPGQTVYFPGGTYKATATLTVPRAMTISGAGETSILKTYGANQITLNGDAVQIEGMLIQSVSSTGATDPQLYVGISSPGTSGTHRNDEKIRHVYMRGQSTAIKADYSWQTVIDDVRTTGVTNAIQFTGLSANNQVTNSHLVWGAGAGSYGISAVLDGATAGEGLMVSNNLIYGFHKGIYVERFIGLQASNNIIDGIQTNGVELNGTGSYGNNIGNNWVYAANYGVVSTNLGTLNDQSSTIRGNYVQTTGNHAVYLDSNSSGWTITANALKHANSYGVYVSLNATSVAIADNIIDETAVAAPFQGVFIAGTNTITHDNIGKATTSFNSATDPNIQFHNEGTGTDTYNFPTGNTEDCRRSTATASAGTRICEVDFYNGATRSVIISADSDGATDSGQFNVWTKATGVGIANTLQIPGAGGIRLDGITPTSSGTQLGVGNTVGFGAGTSGTTVTTTTPGAGTGPNTPQTVVQYLKITRGGTTYWIPLMQYYDDRAFRHALELIQ